MEGDNYKMMKNLGIRRTLDLPFEEAVERITARLKEQGFGVLTEIDLQAALKKKLGIDVRRYLILGACNPGFASRALEGEVEIGLLLPCNVIVYATDDGKVTVSAIDPQAMMSLARNEALEELAREVRERLEKAVAGLA